MSVPPEMLEKATPGERTDMALASGAELTRLTWAQVSAARLSWHGLTAPLDDKSPAAVAARMGGAHAQIMTAAEWSIGQRLPAVTRADIQAALWQDRTLIKTFGPRGTVHLLAAADLANWTGALSTLPRPHPGPASTFLTQDQAESVLAAMDEALASAELTVQELGEAVISHCGAWAGEEVMPAFTGMWPRWRQALTAAAARGVLCFGPHRGRNVTFTSPRRWLPGFEPAAAATAQRWLLMQYLAAYGPATADHLARWLGVPRRCAADLLAAHARELQQVDLEGTLAWQVAGAPPGPGEPRGVRLLPYFDAYVVGGQPRGRLFPGPAANRALVGGQAGTRPVLLIDGVVAGLWHQRGASRAIAITVEPFGDLTTAQHRELTEQAARLADFSGRAVELTLGPVSARSHL
jgi:hypothetical protein